ncbi:MAG TPA: hypothetical protein VNE58_02665 [Casimicrobiaceae bacterium]|nr:hypothetical protein [Casimicrobiaceae bacterium]
MSTTAASAVELVEYYHKDLDHYFVTGYGPEIKALDDGVHRGWSRTGLTIQVADPGVTNAVPVCRFYGNPTRGLDSHFYSASKAECDAVKQKWPQDWLHESDDVFRVVPVAANGTCPANTKAVHRLFNARADINHRYTTDAAVFDAMVAKGYTPEGVGSAQRPAVFCATSTTTAQPAGGLPVCAVTASTPFPVVNTPVTLTATCTEHPTTFAWNNCVGATGNTCTVNASAAGPINYSVVGTNGRGSSAPAAITLNWQAPASAGPTCTVAASNATPILGTPITLTANCSHTPSRFQWVSCSALLVEACNALSECAQSTTTCSPVGNQVGAVHYALIASNSAGSSQKAGVAVDWRSSAPTAPPPSPPSPTPSCVVTPSSTSPAVGTTLTLTASCTSSPTGYVWTNCTQSANNPHTCTATETSPITRIYRVQGRNAQGVGAPSETTVSWNQPPTAPPVCTVSASSPNPYVGGSVTLTANCTQSPTSYKWSNCASSGPTCHAAATTVGPATYSVTAGNGVGDGAAAPITVNWGNPPPAGADFCGSYDRVTRVSLPWGGFIDSHNEGGFPGDGVLVASFTVPQDATGTNVQGFISMVEFIDSPTRRILTLSPSACDFRGFVPGQGGNVDATGAAAPLSWGFGINPQVFYSLSNMPGGGPKVEPGRTYYVNVRNIDFDTGGKSCQGSSCNVRMTIRRPQ